MDEAIAVLLRQMQDGSLVWVSDLDTEHGTTSNNFEHLVSLGDC